MSRVELCLPSIAGYEKIAMKALEILALEAEFPQERIEDVKTAVSEAVLNAMEHGNSFDASKNVKVIAKLENGRLDIEVRDEGAGIKNRPVLSTMEDRIEGLNTSPGFGLFLIEQLMDRVEYIENGGGGCVKLTASASKKHDS